LKLRINTRLTNRAEIHQKISHGIFFAHFKLLATQLKVKVLVSLR